MENIELLCRICLKSINRKSYVKLQDDFNTQLTYLKLFEVCTGYSVDLESEPQNLCLSCAQRLIQAFELRQECDKTQNLLNSRNKSHCPEEVEIKLELDESVICVPLEIKEENERKVVEQPKKFKCDKCSEQFSYLNQFKIHYNEQHKSAELLQCSHCSKALFKPFIVQHEERCKKRSVKSKEVKNEKKLCPICGIFRTQKHVQEHIDRSNNLDSNGDVIERPFTCDLCGRQTASRNNMFLHMQTMHLKVTISCKYCQAVFKNRGRLETHLRRIHPEIKGLLQCKFCEFRAVDRSTLHVHLKKHTGQKPHRCDICHHEFITKTKWRDHRATHFDDTPFACETCNATFKTRKTLNSHKKIHLAHDYECPVCNHTYQTSHLLRIHVTKNHPNYPLPPPGTVLSKSWRKRRAEQEMKDLAIKQGLDQKLVDQISVQEPPPIETKQYFQEYC